MHAVDYDEVVRLYRERETLPGRSVVLRSRHSAEWALPAPGGEWDWDWQWELRSLERALDTGAEDAVWAAIAFLDADPYFFRSGYAKKRLLRILRRRPLTEPQGDRLRVLAVRIVDQGERGYGYFREFTKIAGMIWSPSFDQELAERHAATAERVAGRARMMLAQSQRRRLT
ncbi:MAG: hypothetical protein QOK05_1908 [Chloroflexota bacterium]|jgi:hypothetical protein|nr:hypothetical protein [Chloroflexota bacterium]